jgi:hypothetical protein
MKKLRVFGGILVPIVAIALIAAACSHKQARQLIAGGPAPGSGPEFVAESEQPMPEVQAPIGRLAELNTKGLDVVLVIPRSGESPATVNEMKGKLTQLVESIHRLVPIARLGVVIYDAKPERIAIVPLTDSAQTSIQTISAITAQRSTSENDDIRAAARAAVGAMGWSPVRYDCSGLAVFRADYLLGLAELLEDVQSDGHRNFSDADGSDHSKYEQCIHWSGLLRDITEH